MTLAIDIDTLVICGMCGKAYDGWDVHVTARYADCSVWTTPCCGRQADDRPWTGKIHRPDLRGARIVDTPSGPALHIISPHGYFQVIPIAFRTDLSPQSVKILGEEVSNQ